MKPLIQQVAKLINRIVPAGGTTGQVLSKIDNTDYNSTWITISQGGILTEVDPVFTASTAYGINPTDIIHWNDAYSKEHVHTNISLLNSITSAGAGTSALMNDGTYKLIPTLLGGANTYVQYNNSGVLGGDSTFFFNNSTKVLSVQSLALSSTGTTLTVDGGNNLVFTDSIAGSKTLTSLIGGATNYWTTTTGGIYYTNKVGINNASTLTEALTVTGNIQATNFNSSYIRYKNSNILIGPNAGDNETGSNLLYIAEDNTATPLVYGNFTNQELIFNADTYINSVKRLAFGDSLVTIRRDGSGNLEFRDLHANGGSPVILSDLITGSLSAYALKSDFISYTSVNSISAANLVTWGKASILQTGGLATNFLGQDGNYHAGAGGGVTPTDGIFKFDLGKVKYRPYNDKTEAGGVASSGKFWISSDVPTATNILAYNGYLYTTSLISGDNTSSNIGVIGQSDSGFGIQGFSNSNIGIIGSSVTSTAIVGSSSNGIGIYGISTDSQGIYGQSSNSVGIEGFSSAGEAGVYGHSTGGNGLWGESIGAGYGIYSTSTTGISGVFNNILGNVSNIIEGQLNFVNKFTVDKDGNVNIPTGSTYKINGTAHNHNGTYEPVLGNPAANGYILSSSTGGGRSWIPLPSVSLPIIGTGLTSTSFTLDGGSVTSLGIGLFEMAIDNTFSFGMYLDNSSSGSMIYISNGTNGQGITIQNGSTLGTGMYIINESTSTGLFINSSATTTGPSIDITFNTGSTGKPLQVRSFSGSYTTLAEINIDGELEVMSINKGIILKSPDGTRYRLTMNNGGTIHIATA
jgi:hypothetical protein